MIGQRLRANTWSLSGFHSLLKNLHVGLRAHLKTRQFSSLPGIYFLPEPLVSPLCMSAGSQ